jgi:acyl carrier protein phosphodiesterase
MMTWINPVNWLAETWKQESVRRIQALEEHVTDLDARYAELENRFNKHLATPLIFGAHDTLPDAVPEGD